MTRDCIGSTWVIQANLSISKLLGFFKNFFILFLAVLGLHCCERAFSGCSEQGLLPSGGAQTSHRGGFSNR